MEDVLAVYTRPRDPDRPLVCLDETSKQLIAETRMPIPMKPGRAARVDYEYERNGTANLFVFLDVNRLWRKVKVTQRRTAQDFATCMRDLTDVHYPTAEHIRSGWYSTICRPIPPARSTKPSRLTKRDGCCADWSSITSPSMPVG